MVVNVLIVPNENAILVDTEFGEYYCINGNFYPRVTSIFKGFSPIRKSKWTPDAATLGTMLHYLILSKYKAHKLPVTQIWKLPQDEVYAIRKSGLCMWHQIKDKINVMDVEIPVYHCLPNYAGRADMICEIGGKYYPGDIKTGAWYDYYPMQGAAYYQALKAYAKKTYGIEFDGLAFFRLDINLDRNPERNPEIVIIENNEVMEHLCKFNELAIEFNDKLDHYIKAYSIEISKLL